MQKTRQEIEHNNLEAQLSKLKVQRSNAVQQTRDAVELKEGYLLEVQNLEKELAESTTELSQVLSSIQTRKDQLSLLEDSIEEASSEAENAILGRFDKIDELDIKINDKVVSLSNIRKEIDTLESIIPVIQEQVENNKELAQKSQQRIDVETEQKREELDEITETLSSAIDAYSELISESVIFDGEMAKEREKIETRESDLIAISEDYSKRTIALKQREADIAVIARRTAKKYKEVYPERKLKL